MFWRNSTGSLAIFSVVENLRIAGTPKLDTVLFVCGGLSSWHSDSHHHGHSKLGSGYHRSKTWCYLYCLLSTNEWKFIYNTGKRPHKTLRVDSARCTQCIHIIDVASHTLNPIKAFIPVKYTAGLPSPRKVLLHIVLTCKNKWRVETKISIYGNVHHSIQTAARAHTIRNEWSLSPQLLPCLGKHVSSEKPRKTEWRPSAWCHISKAFSLMLCSWLE